jgi:hypothetical protein
VVLLTLVLCVLCFLMILASVWCKSQYIFNKFLLTSRFLYFNTSLRPDSDVATSLVQYSSLGLLAASGDSPSHADSQFVSKTLSHLTRLSARENYTQISHHENYKTFINSHESLL